MFEKAARRNGQTKHSVNEIEYHDRQVNRALATRLPRGKCLPDYSRRLESTYCDLDCLESLLRWG